MRHSPGKMMLYRLLTVAVSLILLSAGACGQPEKSGVSPEEISRDHNGNARPEQPDTDNRAEQYESGSEMKAESSEPPQPEPRERKTYTTEARLLAVGDIMMHMQQLRAGYEADSGEYRFDFFFDEVRPILKKGDWVLGNLETTFAGPDHPYTGYPRFRSPDSLADALTKAGFHILTTANNHAMDAGEAGVLRTLDIIRDRGMHPVGTAASPEEAERALVLERNGIRMGFLAYTYGTNGIPVPDGKPYLVNLIDPDKIAADIRRARDRGADIVAVGLHMGPGEYHRQPDRNQIETVQQVIDAGADIILGGHPHVVQPYRLFDRESDDGTVKKGVAIYSLGNFISAQVWDYKDYGVIFAVRVRKHFPAETVEIAGVEAIPTYVHRFWEDGKRKYRVLPLPDILEKRNDPLLTEKQYKQFEKAYRNMREHLQSLTEPADTLPSK